MLREGTKAHTKIIVRCTTTRKKTEGRQQTGWKDSCKRGRESVGLKEEDVLDRTKWKNDIQYHSSDPR